MRSGPGSGSTVAKMMKEAGKAAARAQERKRTESMPGNQRGDIGYQEERVAPSVLARRRKQFLEGTILGSLMPEPSIELGAPMSMLGSSTLLGS